jgi:bifunctional UDP-N-acetylglucosamine pyrophosphorylase/glucosamine-1-phosphate N-acetyltransferase
MQAIILAAGRGTRLQPLTDTTPKAMLSINGKPMLQIILEQVKTVGVTEVVIIVNYLKDHIKTYFGNGSKMGLKITYVEQPELRGSADAIARAEKHITDKRFLVIACDSLFETHLLKRLLKHTSPGVFTCTEVEDGRRYGILMTEGKKVVKIIEKPENPPTNLANLSVYILPHEIFKACREVKPGPKGEYWLPEAIQMLIEQGIEFEYEICSHILDIGTPEQLAEAQILAKKLGL